MALAEKIQKPEVTAVTACAPKIRPRPKPKQQWALAAAVMLFGLIVGNVIIQGLVVERNYQISYWQKLLNEQEREIVKVKMEIASLESFDRVQSIAKNELGMKTAGPQDYRLIPSAPIKPPVFSANPGYIANNHNNGFINQIIAWFGEIGKTMASTP